MKINPAVAIGAVLVLGIGGWFVGRSLLDSAAQDSRRDELLKNAQAALASAPEGSEALKLARTGLDEFPDDPGLLLIQGIALVRRGRFTDAETPLERAGTLATDPAVRDEAEFYAAAAHMSRYLETKERGDFNLSESTITSAASGGSHASYANLLLGRAFAVAGAQRDPAKALQHLDAGLAAPPKGETVDLDKLRALADQLRSELNGNPPK